MATYTVKKGDTLGAIAAQLGVADWRTLYVNGTLAGETDPRRLGIGSTITTVAPGSVDPDTPIESAPTTETQPTSGPQSLVDTTPSVVGGEVIEQGAEGPITRAGGILAGGTLLRVNRADRDDFYFMVYQIPGSNEYVYYQFDPQDGGGEGDLKREPNGIPDQIEETFGNSWPSVQVITEDQFQARDGKTLWNVGGAGDVIGVPGTFNQLWNGRQIEALNASGITDPTTQQALINDPAYQQLITQASFPGSKMTQAQFKAELRNLNVYKNVIYPGIQVFYDRGDPDPEGAWQSYRRNVEPIAQRLGFTPDPDGTYKSTVSTMLSKGVSDQEFYDFADTMERIQQNPDLKPVMDQWALQELGRPLDFDEYIDVLAGTTDPELNRVIEAATLQFAADQAGLSLSVQDIRDIAAATDLTPGAALNAFTEADAQLLATPEELLRGYGFGKGDIVDALVGRKPRSGLSIAEITNLQSKVAKERGISDDPSARYFLGFTDAGQPQRAGALSLSQIGG